MDLKEEDILGKQIHNHWYYVSKGRAMRKFINGIKTPNVLDVGAGSGIFSKQLLDTGICESAICVDLNYEQESAEEHNGKPIKFVKSIHNTSHQFIMMMDVLEHVPDDVALLKDFANNLESGGHVFITVPAFQFMWSGHDVFLEHYRRYTIKMTEELIKNAGLTPIKSRYFFGSLFPVIAMIRLIKNCLRKRGEIKAKSELKLYPNWLNSSLITLHDIERNTFFGFNRSFGLSVFCLCRKD